MIAPGTPAPEFSLRRQDGSEFTRADLEGRTTVLVFYPFAFSPVCTDQLSLYDEVLDEFRARGATLYGVSCDASYSQSAFREQLGAGAGRERPRCGCALELPGRVARRAARGQPDLRRARRRLSAPAARGGACAT